MFSDVPTKPSIVRNFSRRFNVQKIRKAIALEAYTSVTEGQEDIHIQPGDELTLIGVSEEDSMWACAVNGKITSVPKHILNILDENSESNTNTSDDSSSSSEFHLRTNKPITKTSTLPPQRKAKSSWTRATATNRSSRTGSIMLGPTHTDPADTLANIFMKSQKPPSTQEKMAKRMRSKSIESLNPAVEMARLLKQSMEKDPLQKASGTVSLNLIANLPLTNKSRDEVLRNEVISELIKTERDYVADLELVIEVFLTPLRASGIVPNKDIKSLFSNLEVIHSINLQMLKELEKRVRLSLANNVTSIGDIFISTSAYLKMYTEYCSNQPIANECLKSYSKDRNFSAWLEICESDPRCRNLGLGSFLIKPIQRICKYPLFFKELLRYTPRDHSDYACLQTAEQKVNSILDYINERKRATEMQQKIMDIQLNLELPPGEILASPTRRYIREAVFCLNKKLKPSEVHVFLFNDLLLLTKQKKSVFFGKPQKLYEFVNKVPLEDAKLLPPVEDEPTEAGFCVLQLSTAQLFQLSPYKEEEIELWMNDITKNIEECQKKQAARIQHSSPAEATSTTTSTSTSSSSTITHGKDTKQKDRDKEKCNEKASHGSKMNVQYQFQVSGIAKKLTISCEEGPLTPEEISEIQSLFLSKSTTTPVGTPRQQRKASVHNNNNNNL
eukprot:TRINITY_DN2074_c0_g2_i6.p1 TRINITY_DN2074_c0_g2~~TRINITY_DN2074_c0_g2_i6.p1  ORF type:complete len:671 (-),score=130.09 TRINITY_DN2074_c0_g2_i6:4-2016(-)